MEVTEMMQRQRHRQVGFAEILSIVAVVLIVLASMMNQWIKPESANTLVYGVASLVRALMNLGVPLLFMTLGSRMLGRRRTEKYSHFMLYKVILGLVIPFVLFSAVYYLNDCVRQGAPMSVGYFLRLFTLGEICDDFRIVYTVILIFLLLPFLDQLIAALTRRELRTLILVILGVTALKTLSFAIMTTGHFMFSSFFLPDLMTYVNFCLLGYYLSNFTLQKKTRYRIYIAALVMLGISLGIDARFAPTEIRGAFIDQRMIAIVLCSMAAFVWTKLRCCKCAEKKVDEESRKVSLALAIYSLMVYMIVREWVTPRMASFYQPEGILQGLAFILIDGMIVIILSLMVAAVTYITYGYFARWVGLLIQRIRQVCQDRWLGERDAFWLA